MSSLDQIVEINISQKTQAVAQASFSIPLIVGPTVPTSGIMNAYTSPAGLLANGYTTSSPEYVYALELFEQPLTPTIFYVGKRTTPVEQVDHITVNTATNAHNYNGVVNGQAWSYTASNVDTTTTIATAIAAAINALTNLNVGAVASGPVVTLTSSIPGLLFTDTTTDTLITIANITPNHGIQDDINALIAINNSWYGMCITEATDADIEQAAALIESLKKIYIAVSDTSSIPTNSSTDVGSVLQSKSYKRTALIYTISSYVNEGKDAAWLGGQLPQVPGSNNWAFKTLFGCTPDVLSANAQVILIGDPVAQIPGKNVNIYQTVGGVNITQMGTMAGGQFIDITVGVDWLQSTIQTNVYSALVNAAKIPYTDLGTAILIQQVDAAIKLGITNGLIDGNSPISITAPPVLSVPTNQRANRVAPTITFSCRLAGAFNAVVVNGTVTV